MENNLLSGKGKRGMITFKFNEKKTTQVAALFIEKEGRKISYMKLIKLLYLADREALLSWERSLSGDDYVSMENGPVLSRVLNIINYGKAPVRIKSLNAYWYEYISEPDNYEIELINNPGTDKLSKNEINLIDKIYDEFGEFDRWDLVEICHDILPEWENVEKTSKPITINKIFEVEQKPLEEIERIEEEVANINYAKELLSIED